MTWAALIPIISQYGLDFAESLYMKWSNNQLPTAADFVELRAFAAKTAKQKLTDSLTAAGIALDSDQAKKLFAILGDM